MRKSTTDKAVSGIYYFPSKIPVFTLPTPLNTIVLLRQLLGHSEF